jgi:serine protease Do
MARKHIIWLGLAIVGSFLLGGFVVANYLEQRMDEKLDRLNRSYFGKWMSQVNTTARADASTEPENSFERAANQTVNSVVYVSTRAGGSSALDKFQDVFDAPARGSGSGVVLSPDGYIITNNHVIENAGRVTVTMNDKSEYEARIIATDPNTDLAVLKIDAEALQPIRFADSDNVRVGNWVVAVGNPFNLTSTVTAGIVSAKARNIGILRGESRRSGDNVDYSIESFIQTDAAVNPGNSGGALVNLTGELIGINTAIASETGSYSGYSFAIPSNLVKKVVTDLIQFGMVQRGFVGVNIRDLDAQTARREGLKVYEGALVTGVAENGAAKAAGLREGDVIVGVSGKKVRSASELQEQVGHYQPGDRLMLDVLRGSEALQIPVVLRNVNGAPTLVQKPKVDRADMSRQLGGSVMELTKEELKERKLTHGIRLFHLQADGAAKSAGIPDGFIIQKVDRRDVLTLEALQTVLAAAEGSIYVEGIRPDGKRSYFSLKVE